ncbi:MAG: class I SAM-dependent methyltransferase [Candidatus Diapherotrites archaeon]
MNKEKIIVYNATDNAWSSFCLGRKNDGLAEIQEEIPEKLRVKILSLKKISCSGKKGKVKEMRMHLKKSKKIMLELEKRFINSFDGSKTIRVTVAKDGKIINSTISGINPFEGYLRFYRDIKNPKNTGALRPFMCEIIELGGLFRIARLSNGVCRQLEAFRAADAMDFFIKNNGKARGIKRKKFVELKFLERLTGKKIRLEESKKETVILARKNLVRLLQKTAGFEFDSFLDVGCGRGALGILVAYFYPEKKVACLDIRKSQLAKCKEAARRLGLKNIEIIQMDAGRISTGSLKKFGLVSALEIEEPLVEKLLELGKKAKSNMIFIKDNLLGAGDQGLYVLRNGRAEAQEGIG